VTQVVQKVPGCWPCAAVLLLMAGCSSAPPPRPESVPPGAQTRPVALPPAVEAKALEPVNDQEQQYGIRYQSLRLSGSGLLLDLRYRVLDPDKAAQVVNHKVQPVVVDPLTGYQFQVPHAQKIGTLRHMGGNLKTGRVYSMLFANPGRTLKSGATVNLVMGDYRLDGLRVE
jgi:hypothetical protein